MKTPNLLFKKTRWVVIAVVLLALGGALAFWLSRDHGQQDALRLYGNVDIREVQLAFRQPGRVMQMAFDEGDAVSAGARLAALDAQPYREALAAAQAQVQVAQAELAKLRRGLRPQEITQAREARFIILDKMNEAIAEPEEMSKYAPRIITVKIPVDKIGEVIGPKGKMINQIQEDTGAEISIEDDGTIFIGATDGPSAEAARAAINAIANPHMPEVGERYLGTVVKIAAFGAFISLLPGKDGLLHVTQMRKLSGGKRIENVEDVVKVGQKILVEIQEIDQRGKLSLVVADDDAASTEESAE